MKQQFNTLNIVTTSMLSAVAVVLANALHHLFGANVASLVSAMHLPIFLAGILCGNTLGLVAGLITPVVSFLCSGRPSFPNQLVPMVVELVVYGFLCGYLRSIFVKGKTEKFATVISLVIAMIVGRLLSSLASTLILYSVDVPFAVAWWTSFIHKFTSTWVGIIIQLALVPSTLLALKRNGVLLKYIDK